MAFKNIKNIYFQAPIIRLQVCQEFSLSRFSRSPPEGSFTRVLTIISPDYISHKPMELKQLTSTASLWSFALPTILSVILLLFALPMSDTGQLRPLGAWLLFLPRLPGYFLYCLLPVLKWCLFFHHIFILPWLLAHMNPNLLILCYKVLSNVRIVLYYWKHIYTIESNRFFNLLTKRISNWDKNSLLNDVPYKGCRRNTALGISLCSLVTCLVPFTEVISCPFLSLV